MKTKLRYGKKADLALALWVKLARAFHTFNNISAKDIKKHGVTQPQFAVLECLGHLGPLTIGDLSRKMLVSGGNMTVVIDNLQKQGLVERQQSRIDRRTVYVRLTADGENWFHHAFHLHARRISELASVLTPEEQKQLARLLRKLGRGLQDGSIT